MKIGEILTSESKQQLKQYTSPKKKRKKKEKVDWHEIMGSNRDTYKRVRGAIRRK